ncbi:MAG: SRPBCC domain-containing protein [Anaerolineae bacterium]|nr:SRPBCC domain-containing protein [Anaerolineae bacterium]
MKFFTATINIKASKERIWAILTDAPNYPNWDPGVIRIEGTIAKGEKVVAYNKISPNRAFPAKVTEFVVGERMAWTGGMPLGLFTGVRTFSLTPKGDGSYDFTLREEFSGPMLFMIGGTIPDMTDSFNNFVKGLKAYAEKS